MVVMKTRAWTRFGLLIAALVGCVGAQPAGAQYTCTTNSATLTITGYTGTVGAAAIPVTINGFVVTAIDDYAFADSSNLTSVTIPVSVTNIGQGAFVDCPNLASIGVDVANARYSSADGVLFDKTTGTLLQFPGGKADTMQS